LNRKLAPEVAIVGAANSGKSTFVNQLFRNEFRDFWTPKVSNVPGETTGLNFYQINDVVTIVDTPGFGMGQPESVNGALVPYLIGRQGDRQGGDSENTRKRHIIFLISIDEVTKNIETLTENHVKILKLLKNHQPKNFSIIINKIDLCRLSTQIKIIYDFVELCKTQNLGEPEILITSGKTGEGMPLVKSFILDQVVDKNKFGENFEKVLGSFGEEYYWRESFDHGIGSRGARDREFEKLSRESIDPNWEFE